MNLERIRRGLTRRLADVGVPVSHRRISSFPFVSGDTFRSVCDLVIDEPREVATAQARLETGGRRSLFVAIDALPHFLEGVSDSAAAEIRLVVHNGDLLPSELLAKHAHRFATVFAVNWVGDPQLIRPLPIGIENAWIGVNGVWPLFHDCVPASRASRLAAPRARQVLIAFNDQTCPEVRGPARAAFLASGLDVDAPAFMSPTTYHERLRNSLFVPSPRGNGIDCHRTWEAIYAGAVPVVLRRDWAFEHLALPVLVVDTWAEAVATIAEHPHALHARVLAEASHNVYAWDFLQDIVEAR